MKKIYTATNPLHARLILGVLHEHGIAAAIQGEALWTARGELPFTPESAPAVWIADDDRAEEALRLIHEHEAPLSPENCTDCGYDLRELPEPRCPECGRPFARLEPWVCPNCGESIEGQFTACWKCSGRRTLESDPG